VSVKVKICGLTNLADAQVAVDAGADYLGFIFYPKSPRYVTPAKVAEILEALDLSSHVQSVSVFVNSPLESVDAVLRQTGLKLAQLHGDEPAEFLAHFSGRGFKAVRPIDMDSAQQASVFIGYPRPPAPNLLLDAYHPSTYGGTGQQADWSMAASMAQSTPRLLLSGGLNAANVQLAIATVSPWGVDVASGVESSPGHKDHEQVRAFISNAQRAP